MRWLIILICREQFSDTALDLILERGTIYLSGGNTYVFLHDARKRDLRSRLEKHLHQCGLVVGASAGSIMVTPIDRCCVGGDTNIPQTTDMTGFGFVDFEFHPHYKESISENKITAYARKVNRTVYACKDGSGILYTNGNIRLFGDVVKF